MTKVGLAQIKIIPGRPDLNVATMLDYMERAKAAQVDLLVFPEFSIPGSLLGDTWEDEAFITDCALWGQKVVTATQKLQGMTVIFGNIVCAKDTKGRTYRHDASFVAQNGKLLGRDNFVYPYRVKTRLPFSRAYVKEGVYFTNLEEMSLRDQQKLSNMLVPVEADVRDQHYHIGCITCADGWFFSGGPDPDVLAMMSDHNEVDFFVNISASYYVPGKNISRHHNFSRQAQRNKKPIIYVNQVGTQNNAKTVYMYDGNSCIYDIHGRVVAAAKAWEEDLVVADLPLDNFAPEVPYAQDDQIDDLYHALVYGIKEFSRKVGIENVVIGLSGGIDSCVSASLLKEALGAEHVLGINMPSRYNSETTKTIAEQLARNLGIRYAVMPVEESVLHTCEQIENTPITNFGAEGQEQLTLSELAKENIQSRDRGARILAAAAAAFGGAAVCNGNKTEIAVGYATMYGDSTGYLAPLGDLWKHQIYQLADYINSRYSCIPEAALTIIPSAELSAQQDVEKGMGDPLYYPYHDYLLRSWVEMGHDITDTLALYVKNNLNQAIGCTSQDLDHACPTVQAFIDDAERWWKQFKGLAVAKRIQAPPVLAVSSKAFGFDLSEAQNGPYFTQEYLQTKKHLLGE